MASVHIKPIDKLLETLNFKQDITQKDLKTHICKFYFILIIIELFRERFEKNESDIKKGLFENPTIEELVNGAKWIDERVFDIEKVVFRNRMDQETQAEDVSKPLEPSLHIMPDSKFFISDSKAKFDFNALE